MPLLHTRHDRALYDHAALACSHRTMPSGRPIAPPTDFLTLPMGSHTAPESLSPAPLTMKQRSSSLLSLCQRPLGSSVRQSFQCATRVLHHAFLCCQVLAITKPRGSTVPPYPFICQTPSSSTEGLWSNPLPPHPPQVFPRHRAAHQRVGRRH
jgi:hypothetical protein